jgi:lysophospholipase L1-like esterase
MDSRGRDVCDRVWPGLRLAMRTAATCGGAYHVVLILAGTNDLAAGVPVATFLSQLASLHAAAHELGARTVAFTIPESAASEQVAPAAGTRPPLCLLQPTSAFAVRLCAAPAWQPRAPQVPWLGALRDECNAATRAWAAGQAADRVLLVEAAELVPYAVGPLWEPDGLHMSQRGYEAFGRGLAPRVRAFVREAASVDPGGGAVLDAATSPAIGGMGGMGGMRDSMAVGARVRVCGLTRATEHNGKEGVLVLAPSGEQADAVGSGQAEGNAEARWGVALEEGGSLAVRAANLELFSGQCQV